MRSFGYASLPYSQSKHSRNVGAFVLGLKTVPELYKGPWNTSLIKSLFTGTSLYGDEQEGYVVRTVDGFNYGEFSSHVGKFVRAKHIKTSAFWMNEPIIPNLIIS